ncbi:myeloid cell surface antigen CD33 isoform X2 [Cavia porcellus]|uniref:myeloid cell surface antigen CD33 isoform X2 n=1 Tax=Cavia porcellus TaxID=10141 RepID=UPI002FE2E47F
MLLPLLLLLLLLWTGEWAQGQRSGHRHRRLPDAEPSLPSRCAPVSRTHRVEVPRSVTVQEGQCVLVPCGLPQKAVSSRNGSVYGYWFQKGADTNNDSPVATNDPQRQVQERTQDRFYLLLDPKTRNCSLKITDAQRGDHGSYFFRVVSRSLKWNFCANQVSVEVTALTHIPDILIPEILASGRPSNLTCSVPWACKQGTPPIFSWVGASVSHLDPTVTNSWMLTLSPWPQDHGTNLTCQVRFPRANVTVQRTVQLNVTGDPKTAAGVVQAVIGIAVIALLAVCLCVIFFIVKTFKKKALKTAEDTKDIEPAAGPSSLHWKPQGRSLHRPGPCIRC